MSAFVEMGGYGGYVWTAYGVAFVIVASLAAAIWRRGRRLRRALRAETGAASSPDDSPTE